MANMIVAESASNPIGYCALSSNEYKVGKMQNYYENYSISKTQMRGVINSNSVFNC